MKTEAMSTYRMSMIDDYRGPLDICQTIKSVTLLNVSGDGRCHYVVAVPVENAAEFELSLSRSKLVVGFQEVK